MSIFYEIEFAKYILPYRCTFRVSRVRPLSHSKGRENILDYLALTIHQELFFTTLVSKTKIA